MICAYLPFNLRRHELRLGWTTHAAHAEACFDKGRTSFLPSEAIFLTDRLLKLKKYPAIVCLCKYFFVMDLTFAMGFFLIGLGVQLSLSLVELQSHFGGESLKHQAVCPQNGSAVLKGLNVGFGARDSSCEEQKENRCTPTISRSTRLQRSLHCAQGLPHKKARRVAANKTGPASR